MLNPFSHNLIEHIASQYDAATAQGVADFFNRLSLPAPAAREYHVTNDNHAARDKQAGYLIYLDPAACVLRLTDDTLNPAVLHPHVLQPIGRKRAGALRIDLNPGVSCPVYEPYFVEDLQHRLKKQNKVAFNDGKNNNIGFLPGLSRTLDNLVIVDPGAFQKLSASTRTGGAGRLPPNHAQRDLYAPLRMAFRAAWGSNASHGNPAALWSLCRAFKESGKLMTAWQAMDGGSKGEYSVVTAARYARHWNP